MRVSEMKFISPIKKYYEAENTKDITITANRVTNKETGEKIYNVLAFTIRNGKEKEIATTGRIEVLFVGNRIYFKDSSDGFKVSNKLDTVHNYYFKLVFTNYGYEFSDVKQYIGDYDLQYDKREELYFIEVDTYGRTGRTGDEEIKARYRAREVNHV